MSEISADAVVIGGGPAGATAALILARGGWDVIVVERKRFPRRKVCGEYVSGTSLPLLEELGVASAFHESAGPAVREVGLFAEETVLRAALPRTAADDSAWGRALTREKLDALLLASAQAAGARVLQPWSAVGLKRERDGFVCRLSDQDGPDSLEVRAPVVLAAHGSWETGTLPTQPGRPPARADDLFGFKAHFSGSSLPQTLMPLLVFPGGYGGMVHCNDGQVSLSCCIRHDGLIRLRRNSKLEAGEAVLQHILDSCLGVRQALQSVRREGPWLGAGPIRPGVRLRPDGGLFRIGNAAGEAHPAVAEGISMAMQGAWLACTRLLAWKDLGGKPVHLARVGEDYTAAWKRCFAGRLHASRLIAHWAMRPVAVRPVLSLLRLFPSFLTLGAHLSGKATRVVKSKQIRALAVAHASV